MRVALVSTKPYDRRFFQAANGPFGHELAFFEPRLTASTAAVVEGFEAVCAFVNDELDAAVLEALHGQGTRVLAMRCAGYNNVDVQAAGRLGMTVVRVPAYSPHGVAEHTLALILALNRKIHRAYNRVREGNFALDGLLGFDMRGRTAGVVGTGKIGACVARILLGFGCRVFAHDVQVDAELESAGVAYVDRDELLAASDIVTLHCPLLPATEHLIDARAIERMREGVMLINTSRGGLVDTAAVIDGLKSGRIGYLGLDVYEEEAGLFFEDKSQDILRDDVFARLLTFPNVIVTGHQAFFTREALEQIATTTLGNIARVERGEDCPNRVR